MTSFAFIFGCVPLWFADGRGRRGAPHAGDDRRRRHDGRDRCSASSWSRRCSSLSSAWRATIRPRRPKRRPRRRAWPWPPPTRPSLRVYRSPRWTRRPWQGIRFCFSSPCRFCHRWHCRRSVPAPPRSRVRRGSAPARDLEAGARTASRRATPSADHRGAGDCPRRRAGARRRAAPGCPRLSANGSYQQLNAARPSRDHHHAGAPWNGNLRSTVRLLAPLAWVNDAHAQDNRTWPWPAPPTSDASSPPPWAAPT